MKCNTCEVQMKKAPSGMVASKNKRLSNGKKSAVGHYCPKCKKMRVKKWKGGRFYDPSAKREYMDNYPDKSVGKWLDERLNEKPRSPREIYAQDFKPDHIDKEDWWNYSEDGSVAISMWMQHKNMETSEFIIDNLSSYTNTSPEFWIVKKHIWELFISKGDNNESS